MYNFDTNDPSNINHPIKKKVTTKKRKSSGRRVESQGRGGEIEYNAPNPPRLQPKIKPKNKFKPFGL